MQKLINLIALLSGLVSLSVVGGGAYLYLNKDALIEDAKSKVTSAATEAIADALPGMLNASMPKLPETTGADLPLGVTSPNIPLP